MERIIASHTFSCGHIGEARLYPSQVEAWRARKTTQATCWPCHCDSENVSLDTAATQLEATLNLPMLIGSDAQVDWARRVRAQVVSILQQIVDGADDRTIAPEAQRCMGERRAFWWLDHKDEFPTPGWTVHTLQRLRLQREWEQAGYRRPLAEAPGGENAWKRA